MLAPLPAHASAALPKVYEGRWAASTEGCLGGNNGLPVWTVKDDTLIGAEGAATLSQVRRTGANGRELIGRFQLEGGGGSWAEDLRLVLSNDGLSLSIAGYGPNGKAGETSMPETLFRCAGAVPRQYLGHWGQNAAQCGMPYATRELTPGGFRMPEMSEWATRIEPVRGRGGGLLMEYRLTVADKSYVGRRVIRLSPDGSRLVVDDLGEIATASADPGWKPDPRKRLLSPGEPPVDQEVLLRCNRKP
jgi:hypothetical protein